MNDVCGMQVCQRTEQLIGDEDNVFTGKLVMQVVDQLAQVRFHPFAENVQIGWQAVDIAQGDI